MWQTLRTPGLPPLGFALAHVDRNSVLDVHVTSQITLRITIYLDHAAASSRLQAQGTSPAT